MAKIYAPAPGGNSGSLALDAIDTVQYTVPIPSPRSDVVGVQLVWTATAGTLNATAVLQETCINGADLATDDDWVDNGDVTFTGASGTDTKELKNLGNLGSAMFRLKLSRSTGTGSVVVHWVTKRRH